jgi:hypothetical protein
LPPLFKGELMRTAFSRNTEITTGLPPFNAMRLETAATMTRLSQEMSQLMQECFLNLHLGNFTESWIEPDLRTGSNGHAGSRPHTEIPADNESLREFGSEGLKMPARFFLQLLVSLTARLFDRRGWLFACKQTA